MSPALVVAAIDGVIKLVEFVQKVIANNKITAAWTPAQRAKVDARWTELQNSSAWQTDSEKG